MGSTSIVCLTQYLRHGTKDVKRKDLELSLDNDERNYYICCDKDSTEVKEDFELLTAEGQGLACLAIIHTLNGFACLEALVPDVSVPMLGKGFDGQSAHDFRVKPTLPGASMRSYLQLRPGEPFYVQDLCLTLVPEDSHEHLVHLATGGHVPSYEDYSQHVSQLAESQDLRSPSRDLKEPNSTILETPMTRHTYVRRTPLIQQEAVRSIDSNGDRRAELPDSDKSAIFRLLQDSDGNIDDRLLEDSFRTDDLRDQVSEMILDADKPMKSPMALSNTLGVTNPNKDTVTKALASHTSSVPSEEVNEVSQRPSSQQQDVPVVTPLMEPVVPLGHPQSLRDDGSSDRTTEDEDGPCSKRRKMLPDPISSEESQDSLEDRTIEVAAPISMTPKASIEPPSSISSRQGPQPRTPSMSASARGSPSTNLTATSSIRSTRLAVKEKAFHSSSQEEGLRILFTSSTSVGDSKAFKKFLAEHGVKIVQNIKDATCLCVGKGELKKTSKLISAVLFGLDIITEDWVTDSVRLKKLQEYQPYLARDPQTESDWGIKLDEAIERGRQKICVFQGWDVVFTAKAKKDLGKSGFEDLKDIVTCAGANKVGTSIPKTSPDEDPPTLIIASPEDASAASLKGRRCFTKDIIGLSVLRGRLDTDNDEFLICTSSQQKENNKRKR